MVEAHAQPGSQPASSRAGYCNMGPAHKTGSFADSVPVHTLDAFTVTASGDDVTVRGAAHVAATTTGSGQATTLTFQFTLRHRRDLSVLSRSLSAPFTPQPLVEADGHLRRSDASTTVCGVRIEPWVRWPNGDGEPQVGVSIDVFVEDLEPSDVPDDYAMQLLDLSGADWARVRAEVRRAEDACFASRPAPKR